MGLYNFAPYFVEGVLDGTLRQTIRSPRLRQDKPGDVMHLYTGLRRPGATLLWRCPCIRAEALVIWESGEIWIGDGNPLPSGLSSVGWEHLKQLRTIEALMEKGFRLLLMADREQFARADGFDNWAYWIRTWRRSKLPFYGGIWHWDYERRTKDRL
jgi:hypothetical protein